MKKKKISMLIAIIVLSNMVVPSIAMPISDELIIESEERSEDDKVSDMESFKLAYHPNFEEYKEVFKVSNIEDVSTNGGHYGASTPERAIDNNTSTHWETRTRNSDTFKNEFIVEFDEVELIDRMSYKIRSSKSGFMNEYEIYTSKTSNGDDFELIATGQGDTTLDVVEIDFEATEAKRVKIVFLETNGPWASISEVEFYRYDELKERVESIFEDNLYTIVSEEYNNIEKLEALELEVVNHPYTEDFMSTISLAKDIINGVHIDKNEIFTLSQRGNEDKDRNSIKKRFSGGNLDLTGYYLMPGESLEVFVDADENGILPQVVFAQVGEAETNDNFRMDLIPGKNVIQAPEDYTKPFAVYLANRALPEDQAYAPRVTVSGNSLEEYPIYIHGITDVNEYIKEVASHRGANMTDVMGEKFLVSARNSEAQIAYVQNGHTPEKLVKEMENLINIYEDLSGLDENDENPVHRPSQALYHAKFDNMPMIYATNEFIHSTYNSARTILSGEVYGWAILHEYGHQVESLHLLQSEVTTNIYSTAASQILGIDLEPRFGRRQDVIDEYIVTKEGGYDDFDYHAQLLVIYQILNYFGLDTYSEAYRLTREEWPEFPTMDGTQATVIALSEVTGYDLAPHFEFYKYEVLDETKEYTSQFKELDIELKYTSLDAYDMIKNNVEVFNEETKAIIENIETDVNGFKLKLATSDNNEGIELYEIYRDGELVAITREDEYIDEVDISDASRTYKYEVVAYDYRVNESIKSDEVIASIMAEPTIEVAEDVVIELNEEFNPLDYVNAKKYNNDEIDKNDIKIIKNTVDNTKTGIYEVVYQVEDQGYTVTKEMSVQVIVKSDYVSDIVWESATTGWSDIGIDTGVKTYNKIKLNVDGEITEFDKGIAVVADSEIVYDIEDKGYDYFTSYIGAEKNYDVTTTSINFKVLVDDEIVYQSDLMGKDTQGEFIKIPLEGAKKISLIVDDNGDGLTGDFAAWADAKFIDSEEVSEYTVSFELNGGEGDFSNQQVIEGETVIVSENPTKDGYIFDGWYTDSEFTNLVDINSVAIEEDTTFYAKWVEARTLAFQLNGGTGNFPTQVIPYGGKPTAPTVEPTREGYNFVGWYLDSNLTKPMIFENWVMRFNGTVFAKWEKMNTVNFELNGGEGNFPNQTLAEGESLVVTENPTRAGYIFDGWYSDSEFTNLVNLNEVVIEEDTTFYAKWVEARTLTFQLNGGTGNFPAQVIPYGEKAIEPTEEPTKEGYKFLGWYMDGNLTKLMNFEEFRIQRNGAVFAKWGKINEVSFELNGGKGDFPNTEVIEGESLVITEEPIKDGYIFDGWYADSNLTIPVNLNEVEIDEDTTFYAKWNEARTLSFQLNGGVGYFPTQTIAIGGQPTRPTTEPTKAGYKFVGWYVNSRLTVPMVFEEWKMNSNGSVFAKWEKVY